MKHVGKQPLFLFKLILWCKSIQEWGEYMPNLFNKGPQLLKRVLCVIVSSIFLTTLEQFWLAAYRLHSALVLQLGSRLTREESFAERIDQVTQSWLLTISAGPLVRISGNEKVSSLALPCSLQKCTL